MGGERTDADRRGGARASGPRGHRAPRSLSQRENKQPLPPGAAPGMQPLPPPVPGPLALLDTTGERTGEPGSGLPAPELRRGPWARAQALSLCFFLSVQTLRLSLPVSFSAVLYYEQ